jgi:hypothetical protein
MHIKGQSGTDIRLIGVKRLSFTERQIAVLVIPA